MGAGIIAFTLTRKAIIAEGPSETILLPRLLREANQVKYLDFQVAPGIANISKNNAKDFELEAAKVAYLVDRDEGGLENKKKLKKGGVDEEKIISLPEDYSIEDFINPNILSKCINREFKTSGKEKIQFDLNRIPIKGRINWFQQICKQNSVELPSKVKLAENISKISSNEDIVDPLAKSILIELYNKIIQLTSV